MGSVKSIENHIIPSTGEEINKFVFSDGFSVFDLGWMEIDISGKGASLDLMGQKTFELAEKAGIPTHSKGVINNQGEVVSLDGLENPTNQMAIDLLDVPPLPSRKKGGKLVFDYDTYNSSSNNRLIPLEVIYRNSIPPGSSSRKKHPKDLGLNLDEWPEETVKLDEPITNFTTKLEPKDRKISEEEARRISGLSYEEFEDLKYKLNKINYLISENAKKAGISNEDGKLEFGYENGEIILVDVAGTPDESRFEYNGEPISKQILRDWYKENSPEWYEGVKRAKKRSDEIENWQSLVRTRPDPLPEDLKGLVGEMYRATANAYTGINFFDTRSLHEITERIQSYS